MRTAPSPSGKADAGRHGMTEIRAIRPAKPDDISRVAEIFVFNYRLNFYPIFRNDGFYFRELRVPEMMEMFRTQIDTLWVYDDGAVKGFVQAQDGEVKRLFVEPVLQGQSIGAKLIEYAALNLGAHGLWALEKNTRAIAFYERHGFFPTGERKPEEDTDEYLVRLERKPQYT